MREGGIVGRAVITGGGALVGTASIDGSATDQILGTLTITDELGPQLRPGLAGTLVEPSIEIRIAGSPVPTQLIRGLITYRTSLDDFMQGNSFAVVLTSAEGLYGNPEEYHGPPFGKAQIDIDGVYRTASGERRIPLMRDGTAHLINRSGNAQSGYTEAYTITDAAGKIDQEVVTLVLPPGHGLTRGAIVQRLFEQVGVTKFRLEPGRSMFKMIDIIGGDPFRTAQALEEVEGRALFFDHEGFLVNPVIGNEQSNPIRWRWDERDFLSIENLQSGTPGDALTEATITGMEQLLRDQTEGDAVDSKTIPVIVMRDYSAVLASYRQATNCALTFLDPPPPVPRRQKYSETFTTTENRRGKLVFQMVESNGWKHLETARYVFNPLGGLDCRGPIFLLAGATVNGSEPAFSGPAERWTEPVSRQWTRHYYDRVGYTGPSITPGDPQQPWSNHFVGRFVSTNFKLGSESEKWGFYIRRAAVKHKGTGQQNTPWDEIDPITGREVLGNGEGVTGSVQTFMRTGRTVEVIEATDDGYTAAVHVYKYGWVIIPGDDYQFADGTLSSSEFEQFKLLEQETTLYATIGDRTAKMHSVTTFRGDGTSETTMEATFIEGAPPPVDRLTFDEPKPEDYDTPEEFEAARIARAYETRPIKTRFTSADLEEVHYKRKTEQASDYAEDTTELGEMGRRAVEWSAAMPYSFVISVNYDVRIGQRAHLTHRQLGWNCDVQIHDVEHVLDPSENNPSAYNVTRILAKKYPPREGNI